MKKIILTAFILISAFSFSGCKGKSDYKLRLYYITTNSKGMAILVNRASDLTAPSDTDAYKKASEIFDEHMALKGDDNHVLDHFELYNYKDERVIAKY
ncbi:hypothetical protein [Mucilaginibacter glaciei]|uniref:Uncharacterized protein n=1 Tax=Mucilaginibacter glaciei TaxID=2772109 RepID=A0A926S2M3_9SPHI|nr:hypothetical protein [Mucilaginibacter glaciei]MBD1394298.1 hypothetical protein [Mucilaginibacter glaciei]